LVILGGSFQEYAHNYPNPFRAGSQDTRIAYFLNAAAPVSLKIYAMTGELVFEKDIDAGSAGAQAGPQETTWDGRNGQGEIVRNGVYVCVLNAGSNSAKFRIAVAK
jgi:flagellar hook assembly protein FlgD